MTAALQKHFNNNRRKSLTPEAENMHVVKKLSLPHCHFMLLGITVIPRVFIDTVHLFFEFYVTINNELRITCDQVDVSLNENGDEMLVFRKVRASVWYLSMS